MANTPRRPDMQNGRWSASRRGRCSKPRPVGLRQIKLKSGPTKAWGTRLNCAPKSRRGSRQCDQRHNMALFQPTYTNKKTGERKTSRVWWYEFVYAGNRIRESAKTTRKTIAENAEKDHRK